MSARGRHIAMILAVHACQGFAHFSGSRRSAGLARELRIAFERLGPAFVKLGQLISVRPDLFGPELVFEMEKLQDSVAAVPASQIRAVIEAEFGRPVSELFSAFEDRPVASASIAQVHRATLARDYRPVVGETLSAGTRLAVKVVRPGAERLILDDIAAARPVAAWLGRLGRLQRYNLPALLDEFASTLRGECDLRREAGVADRFAHDFRDDPLVIAPRVVWPLTSRRVLTTEFVDGWRLSEIGDAERAGIDGRALAIHGAEVFMRGVLVLGRYHADLHPANLFVTPDGRICYLDFGIVGRTEPSQRTAIAQVLAATVYGDADRALRYSAELGLVVPADRQPQVRARIESLMRETLAAPPRDVRAFAIGFLRIMDDERVEIPVGYGLLVKALVTVEGVARRLYPDIDITDAAKPYATRLIAQRMLSPQRLYAKAPDIMRAVVKELAE